MNKRQLDTEKAKLADEKKVLLALKKEYEQAAKDVQGKIHIHDNKIDVILQEWDGADEDVRSILQSQIYQKKFQEQLKAQIDDTVKKLNGEQYKSIEEYLKDCYTTSFVGSAFDQFGQGIPIVSPIDRKAMVKAVTLDPKLSNKLYGSYMEQMKDNIRAEISRGIATADSFEHIARNISNRTNQSFNKTMRIVRTEGHAVQIQATWDNVQKAKAAGADIVKQWDATLDKRTRDSHRRVDGEIRELGEKFSNGMMYPSDRRGGAAEVINCRCTLLQRARWALDDEELETLKKRAEYFGLDKTDNFREFEKKFLKAAEKIFESPVIQGVVIAKAVEDFTETLEKSQGVESHVVKMRMHAEYVDYEENTNLPVPFTYNVTKDAIEYNPTAPNFDLYDLNFVQAHELTHRMDILEYDSISHPAFVAAIDTCRQRVMENAAEIQRLFDEGGAFADSPALSDIISALSNNEITVKYGHPDEYWEKEENVIREIFANVSALDVLDSETKKDVESLLKELFESYEDIVK